MKKSGNRIKIFGLELLSSTQVELLAELRSHLEFSRKLSYIVTPNPEQVMLSRRSAAFRQALQEAEYQLPDGMGVVWASRVMKLGEAHLRERIAGVDVATGLLAIAFELQLPVLIVGGRDYHGSRSVHIELEDEVGRRVATPVYEIRHDYPDLTLPNTYWTPGYEQIARPSQAEEQALVTTIQELKPAVVFVAFGAPHQELWLRDHRKVLEQAGVRLGMATGGSFDFLFGKVPRAPKFLREQGLEWLHRLSVQPWRWRRQLRLIEFLGLVVREPLRK